MREATIRKGASEHKWVAVTVVVRYVIWSVTTACFTPYQRRQTVLNETLALILKSALPGMAVV